MYGYRRCIFCQVNLSESCITNFAYLVAYSHHRRCLAECSPLYFKTVSILHLLQIWLVSSEVTPTCQIRDKRPFPQLTMWALISTLRPLNDSPWNENSSRKCQLKFSALIFGRKKKGILDIRHDSVGKGRWVSSNSPYTFCIWIFHAPAGSDACPERASEFRAVHVQESYS